jgi:hypothetical protein
MKRGIVTGKSDEPMQLDPEAILRLTVQTWTPSTPTTAPKGPGSCPHCEGMGLGSITVEKKDYQVFCECRLREWEWDSLKHWKKLSAIPHGTKLPDLKDIKPWSEDARWRSFSPALGHAKHTILNPLSSKWMTLLGGVGTGKTMLLLAIYAQLRPYAVYLGAGDLTSAIFESFGGSGETEELTTELAKVPVLLLDDFGVDTANRTIQNKIMQILDLRYRLREYRPTVLASNLNRKELTKFNARVASRVLDEDLAHVLEIRLPDYRRRSESSKQTVIDRSGQK